MIRLGNILLLGELQDLVDYIVDSVLKAGQRRKRGKLRRAFKVRHLRERRRRGQL